MTEPEPPVINNDIPLPPDMPEMPEDIAIIARLIDANCRAHSDLYGFHLDSRCLSHYNEGIVRLAQAGWVDLYPVLDPQTREPTGELYEESTAPAEALRVRASYSLRPKGVVRRPTTDPIWTLQAAEISRLQAMVTEMR